jgi:hypothetical protein
MIYTILFSSESPEKNRPDATSTLSRSSLYGLSTKRLTSTLNDIQGVTEKSAFILTGNRTHLLQQFFKFFFSKINSQGF